MEDRRKFIKQGAILATTLSIGGVSSALMPESGKWKNVKNIQFFDGKRRRDGDDMLILAEFVIINI